MKRYLNFSVLVPVISGVIIGMALFVLGAMDDAPGACLMGICVAFLLILWGICKAGVINNGQYAYIVLLFFGVVFLVMSVVLKFDGELDEAPNSFFIGLSLGAVLLGFGLFRWIKGRQSKKSKKIVKN